jgi:transketolase
MRMSSSKVENLAINTLRFLAADAIQKANSGHPGLPMGMAAAAYTLWTRHLKFDPGAPDWPDRDRFVLSAGHGSMLLRLIGRIGIASCSPRVTARCCFTPCCI